MPRSSPRFFAAIDLGSNSFHMIVAGLKQEQLSMMDRIREPVRLANGLDENGNISDEAMERAINCLQRFGQRLRDLPDHNVRAVGTNTLRNANNSKEFIQKAEEALGHPIHIISGIEEARLIYLGVAHSLAVSEEKRLVMDIGGGSTELIIGDNQAPIHKESMEMGCVTVTKRFFADGKINDANIERARRFARTELAPHARLFKRLGWGEAIGASGTLRSAIKIISANGWHDSDITPEYLHKILDALKECGTTDKVKLDGLSEDRAPVIIGGIIILIATFEALEIKQMQVSDRALREGLIYDLLGRYHNEDVRNIAIGQLATRYHSDSAQADRIKKTALKILDQLNDAWSLPEQSSQWLCWSADVHEIGLSIAHSRHHHHAAYILTNADISGFSKQEQLILGLLVRGHRRKLPVKLYKEFSKERCKTIKRLTVILRLACILHRSRRSSPLPEFSISTKDKEITLKIDKQWLDEHPLTQTDLEQEQGYLTAVNYNLRLD